MAGNTDTAAAISTEIISYLLDGIGYSPKTLVRDLELESLVKQSSQSWSFEERIRPHTITALTITECAYGRLSNIHAKVAITLYTAFLTSMDDPRALGSSNYLDKLHDLCDGSARSDPGVLGQLSLCLADMWNLFPSFSAGLIFISTLQFMNGQFLENEVDVLAMHRQTLGFVEYRRNLSGIAESYALFIWDRTDFPDEKAYLHVLPDAVLYINCVNDILSFYKEELAGETETYIHGRASVAGQTLAETLRQVTDEIIAAVMRVRGGLTGAAREAWDSFEKGYIHFHMVDPRYRLREIVGGEYLIELSDY